jgi:anti-anti-sigma factor
VVTAATASFETPPPTPPVAGMSALAGRLVVDDREGAGVWLVTLEGEHDISTVLRIEDETRDVWPSCSLLVVDLSAVSFIDASVINWLLRTRRRLAEDGHHALRIVRGTPGGAVERVFEILTLDEEFACYRTQQEALSQLPTIAKAPVERHASHARKHVTHSRSPSHPPMIDTRTRGMVE